MGAIICGFLEPSLKVADDLQVKTIDSFLEKQWAEKERMILHEAQQFCLI